MSRSGSVLARTVALREGADGGIVTEIASTTGLGPLGIDRHNVTKGVHDEFDTDLYCSSIRHERFGDRCSRG